MHKYPKHKFEKFEDLSKVLSTFADKAYFDKDSFRKALSEEEANYFMLVAEDRFFIVSKDIPSHTKLDTLIDQMDIPENNITITHLYSHEATARIISTKQFDKYATNVFQFDATRGNLDFLTFLLDELEERDLANKGSDVLTDVCESLKDYLEKLEGNQAVASIKKIALSQIDAWQDIISNAELEPFELSSKNNNLTKQEKTYQDFSKYLANNFTIKIKLILTPDEKKTLLAFTRRTNQARILLDRSVTDVKAPAKAYNLMVPLFDISDIEVIRPSEIFSTLFADTELFTQALTFAEHTNNIMQDYFHRIDEAEADFAEKTYCKSGTDSVAIPLLFMNKSFHAYKKNHIMQRNTIPFLQCKTDFVFNNFAKHAAPKLLQRYISDDLLNHEIFQQLNNYSEILDFMNYEISPYDGINIDEAVSLSSNFNLQMQEPNTDLTSFFRLCGQTHLRGSEYLLTLPLENFVLMTLLYNYDRMNAKLAGEGCSESEEAFLKLLVSHINKFVENHDVNVPETYIDDTRLFPSSETRNQLRELHTVKQDQSRELATDFREFCERSKSERMRNRKVRAKICFDFSGGTSKSEKDEKVTPKTSQSFTSTEPRPGV